MVRKIAVCRRCGHEVIPGPNWSNETSLCQVCLKADSSAQQESRPESMGSTPLSSPEGTARASSDGVGDNSLTGERALPAADGSTPAREDGETIRKRFLAEGRWREISLVRDRMMVEAKRAIPDKEERRAWVFSELDKMYPPVQAKPAETDIGSEGAQGLTATKPIYIGKSGDQAGSDSGSIHGLAEIPADWPQLASNASMASELGWVQANRLRIVEERPGKATRVRLDQALSPAPSWAALAWLETSIRSYAKFLDAAVKVTGGDDGDEGAVMRAERRSTDEVRALLREMEEAEGCCPSCGKPF